MDHRRCLRRVSISKGRTLGSFESLMTNDESADKPKQTAQGKKRKTAESRSGAEPTGVTGSGEGSTPPESSQASGDIAGSGSQEKQSKESKGSKRRVAKTMLENPVGNYDAFMTEQAQANASEPSQAQPDQSGFTETGPQDTDHTQNNPSPQNRRVAKTMLENTVGDASQYQYINDTPADAPAGAVEDAYQAVPQTQSNAPAPHQPGRRVAKTILENPVGNYDNYVDQAQPDPANSQAMDPQQASIQVQHGASSQGGSETPQRRVAKTMLENPTSSNDNYPPQALSSVDEASVGPAPGSVAHDQSYAPRSSSTAERRERRIARTLLENSIADFTETTYCCDQATSLNPPKLKLQPCPCSRRDKEATSLERCSTTKC